MPSPRSFSASSLDGVNDFDLDDLCCTLDIVHEIDKFLEGLTSDGADLPVNNDKQIDNNIIDEIKTADLEVVNNNTPTNQIDVEFVGKDSAVFQLLEDHENYGVYEHNPNECNWNVFYKTLPPGEQQFVKVEPKTEIVNDYFNTDYENNLETFSFNIDNTQEHPVFEKHASEVFSTGADTSEISFSDNELENFSFSLKYDNIKEKPIIGEHSSNLISTDADTSEISFSDNELENFSFSLKYDNIKEKPIIGEHSSNVISTGADDTSEISFSDNELENFSFSLKYDNIKEKPIIGEHSSNVNLTDADTSEISFSDNELENFSFSLKYDNIKKNGFRNPNPWYRKDSTQKNNVFQHKFKNQYKRNSSLLHAPNNNNNYKNSFRKPNPWYRKDSTIRNNVTPRNNNLPSNNGNFNNFKNMPIEIQGNTNFSHSASLTRNNNELINFQFGKNNSQFVPKYIQTPTINTPRQSHLPPVPLFRAHGIVGEYLCPVSLVGTTIKFVSRKLANTSMREQIIIELATHGVIENNWWTPDDMFYATYKEISIAKHVFKIYPHNSKSSY